MHLIENVGGGAGGSAGANCQAGSAGGGGAPVDAGAGGRGTPVPGQNVIADPSFESGFSPWSCLGSCILSLVTDVAHSGTASSLVRERTQRWQGPMLDIEELVVPGSTYQISAWLQLASGDGGLGSELAQISLRRQCAGDGEPEYLALAVGEPSPAEWRELSASFEAPTCELTQLAVYFEGPAAGVDFYLDDVSLAAMP